MKLQLALIALTTSILIPTIAPVTIAETNPPTDTEITRFDAAKTIAAKITVRIKIGDGGGSGVLLTKKANTYMVLTNAHVVRQEAGITIQTPDGKSHTARRVKDIQVGNFDLALLEFTSSASYQLAKFENFDKRYAALNEGREIFGAGFPYDANEMRFVEGEVTQLPQEAFRNGTQIGYVTKKIELKQGMSGGPILDSFGNLIGIHSTLSNPVIDSYIYADGSKPPRDKIAQYRQANWGVPIYNLLTRLNPDILYAHKELPKLQRAVTPSGYMAELDRKARQVTVRIEYAGGNGSGVIVATEGGSYYVLTALHVVERKDQNTGAKELRNAKLITHDQKTYTINPSQITRAEGTDLAVIKFTSTQPYPVAILGDYSVSDKSIVFPGGWPAPARINSQQWQWQLNPGNITSQDLAEFRTQDKVSFSTGYDLIYSSVTYGGMSGGPVFDSDGRVIGIHGKAEGDSDLILGNSLGISIKTFVGLAAKLGVNERNLKIATTDPNIFDGAKLASVNLIRNNIATPINEGETNQWIEYGNQLYRLGKNADAVKAFDRAITLNPNSLLAYYGKGLALRRDKSDLAALAAFDRSIALIPPGNEARFYYLWKYRALTLDNLKRYKESLESYDRAISLNPQDTVLMSLKATVLYELERHSEIIEVYNKVIAIKPNSFAYTNRGNAKYSLGDNKGAISDYDIAIKINPKDDNAYYRRGFVKNLSIFLAAVAENGTDNIDQIDQRDGFADLDMSIQINPKSSDAYSVRGTNKFTLGDYQGAIVDLDMAIKIAPEYGEIYYDRGRAKSRLGNKKEAIADLDMAIKLYSTKYTLIQLKEHFSDDRYYHYRGIVKSDLGDFQGAIADYNMAIKIKKKLDTRMYLDRSLAKYSLGDYNGAIDDCRKVNANWKEFKITDFDNVYLGRGLSRQSEGENQEALSDFSMTIKLNPKKFVAYLFRGYTKSKLKDNKGAIDDYNATIKINPKEALAYHLRGVAKYSLGDIKGGIIDSEAAISFDNPKSSLLDRIYGKAAFMKYDLGDVSGAIDYWRKSLSLKPDNPDAQLGLAIALYKQGKESEASQLGIATIKKDRRFINLDFLRKNDWSENIIKDAVKFFQTPQIAAIR